MTAHESSNTTLDGFKKVDNAIKCRYPGYFESVWENYYHSYDIDSEGVEKSKEGFKLLKAGLLDLREEYSAHPFKKRFTQAFIDVVDKLLDSEVKS